MSAMIDIAGVLQEIGDGLLWWRAQLRLIRGAACLLAALLIFSAADLLFRLNMPARLCAGGLLLAAACFTAWLIIRTLRRRLTTEGVAAAMEKAFPELDNRLINYIQFARGSAADPFKAAYVAAGAPDLKTLDYARMKSRRAHNRGLLMLAALAVFLVLPAVFVGKAWPAAVWRMVNPFTRVQPVTLTRLLDVSPGDKTILQGSAAVLAARVDGHPGHRALVDVHPGDAVQTTYDLGKIVKSGVQEFTYSLPRVNTRLRYRFRAGDAPASPWYTLAVRPPPALTRIRMEVVAPEYTGRAPQFLDARTNDLRWPAGSTVKFLITGSDKMKLINVAAPGCDKLELRRQQDRGVWLGSLQLTEPGILAFNAEDSFGESLCEEVAYQLEPDQPPVIEIISPAGRGVLPKGEQPKIVFHIADDYGLAEVQVERINPDQPGAAAGESLQAWRTGHAREFNKVWSAEQERGGEVMAFRIAARDNNPFLKNITRSRPIIFNSPAREQEAESRENLEKSALAGLTLLIGLQKANIEQTRARRANLAVVSSADWRGTLDKQAQIQSLTRELLHNPIRPLGGQTETVKKLFLNEMPLAIDVLDRIAAAAPAVKPAAVAEALRLQEAILRGFTAAQVAAEQAAVSQRIFGLSAILQALIGNQRDVLKKTKSFAGGGAKVSPLLVEQQDALASDMVEFVKTCKKDAEAVRANDPDFADILVKLTSEAEKRAVRNDMLMAAERLERNAASEAVPFARKALGSLQALQELLEGVRAQQIEEDRSVMIESLEQARQKVERMKELHRRMLEAMDAVRGQVAKNDEMFDAFLEEYKELAENTKEVMLAVPADLHVFTDLNPANDLVEDVFSVFEEIEQVEGSEKMKADDIVEFAYAKEQQLVEQMEEILEKVEDMEKWLMSNPDNRKVETEAFDREEMPESGIAMGPLASQLEDLIGELLKESKVMSDEADDGATTHAMPDTPAGWDVMEGDISSFSADGVSGNTTPDHKEQDGRSLVGREGMSVGETAAGSGTLSEGDKNIEARRTEEATQSGQVDVDGEGQTAATGGGKLATGKADEHGMGGGAERMDSTEQGSWVGMAAMMARRADAIYAQASLQKVRVNSLQEAARHLRQSGDAIAKGRIEQMKEFQNLAATALQKARIELAAGPAGPMDVDEKPGVIDSFIGGGPELAPQRYRNAVADYYKLLNESL